MTRWLQCSECPKLFHTWARWQEHLDLRHPEADHRHAKRVAQASQRAYRVADDVELLSDEMLMIIRAATSVAAKKAEVVLAQMPSLPVPVGPGDERLWAWDEPPRLDWSGTVRLEIDAHAWPGGFDGWRWWVLDPDGVELESGAMPLGELGWRHAKWATSELLLGLAADFGDIGTASYQ